MKKIAIFGGAFNPIHLGHINLALMLDARVKFDRIILIPSHISPHKDSHALVPGELRMDMCRLVAEHYEKFEVSDSELRREGKSFTVDTVEQLKKDYPGDKLYMIVGSDMFLSLDTWHSSSALLKMVTVCAAAREPGEYDELIEKQRELDTKNVKSVVCEIEAVPISSTQIRDKIKNGESVSEWLPDYVEQYITEHKLYKVKD